MTIGLTAETGLKDKIANRKLDKVLKSEGVGISLLIQISNLPRIKSGVVLESDCEPGTKAFKE